MLTFIAGVIAYAFIGLGAYVQDLHDQDNNNDLKRLHIPVSHIQAFIIGAVWPLVALTKLGTVITRGGR